MGYKIVLASAPLKGQLPAQNLKVKLFTEAEFYIHMHHAPAPRVRAATQQARVRVFSWNAPGLSAEANAELEHFLQTSNYAIALVQETHWSTSGEWKRGDWTFIHSASQRPRQDGVMVAIRTSMLTSEEVLWQEIHPGRLLRVRAVLDQQQWDIFSLYQHAMSAGSASDKDKLLSKRNTVWKKLDKAIHGTPYRSMILLGGDFNTSLAPHPPNVGHGILQGSTAADLEQERLLLNEFFCRHRLSVLNSWGRQQATYERPTGNTQIDFLVVRQQVADSSAKQAGPVDSGLAAWRRAGHKLLGGNLRATWKPWKEASANRTTKQAKPAADPREKSIVALRALVKMRCPGREAAQRLPPLAGAQEVECHWKLRKMLKQVGGVLILKHAFRAMVLHAKEQRAHRELKKACRQRKRARLLSCLQQIEHASERGDCKAFDTVVKLVFPKPFVPKIKLRDEHGMTLTRPQEGELLRKHAAKLFHADTVTLPLLEPAPPEVFSRQRWEWAIMQLCSLRRARRFLLDRPKLQPGRPHHRSIPSAWRPSAEIRCVVADRLFLVFGLGFSLPGCA